MNGNLRLATEIQTILSTVADVTDEKALAIRLEELLNNYEIARRTDEEMSDDVREKAYIFINAKRLEGLADVTLYGYEHFLERFVSYWKKPLASVTTADLRSFIAQNSGHLRKSTQGNHITMLRTFFEWCHKEELILRNPAARLTIPKTEKRMRKALTVTELEAIREACITDRERAVIETFYSTGCRISELMNANISDIDWHTQTIRVIGKGDKERKVFLSDKARYYLERYLNGRNDDCDALFTTIRKPYRRALKNTLSDIIHAVWKRSGVTTKVHPHIFRHTFATLSMDAGIELADLQHLLGHDNPSTTLTYAKVSEARKRNAFQRYHVQ